MTGSQLQIRIRIADVEEFDALEQLTEEAPQVETEVVTERSDEVDAAIAPVVAVLVGGVAVAWLSELVWEWINRIKGGLVVDLRPEAKDTFSRDREVPFGFIVTYPADGGKVTIETKDAPKGAVERLLTDFIDGALKNAADIAGAATSALGGGKVDGSESPSPA